MQFLTVPQVASLLQWKKEQVHKALEQGVLVGLKAPNGKWAVMHPGVAFIEYVKDPLARMPYIAILGAHEVAAVLGRTPNAVYMLVSQGYLRPARVRVKRNDKLLFTPMEVRRYLLRSQKRDPMKRRQVTLDDLVAWFHRSMEAPVPDDPVERVEDEWRYIMEMPEPQRARMIEGMLRLAEEARAKIQKETTALLPDE